MFQFVARPLIATESCFRRGSTWYPPGRFISLRNGLRYGIGTRTYHRWNTRETVPSVPASVVTLKYRENNFQVRRASERGSPRDTAIARLSRRKDTAYSIDNTRSPSMTSSFSLFSSLFFFPPHKIKISSYLRIWALERIFLLPFLMSSYLILRKKERKK